ncbi:hypothetical protein HNQ80_003213 [Anaerosolibacter carboniphilus]|uniref:Uncharacterized protein n=1 Tax=Anaerosolibacter carboniphilus TaxID=1417629 RepID=A0A841KUN9_9FIRM|nr:polynucleotide phosphorylase [Anaerosolibacter carboniphilus]MBB6217107.1 hypothetical protein [Anaerosolibacter carboniphilus]
MQQQYLDSLKALNFADLSEEQERHLRDLEKKFNSEFGKEVYFMVMEK